MEHFAEMARDEQHHEEKLIEMIDEERIAIYGFGVLGLNGCLGGVYRSIGRFHAGAE